MHEGLIIKGISGFYYIKADSKIYECKARGIFRKNEILPTVGDYVEFSISDENNLTGMIEKIKPRKNFLVRPPVANIDKLITVFSVKSPALDLMLLDKLIIKAAEIGIKPIICINKMDLSPNGFEAVKCYENAGFETLFISAARGIGIDNLKEKMKGKVSILAGPSGVGKSTIVNALDIDVSVKTGEVSNKIDRGKHTTRHVELFEIKSGGYIADTPGFTALGIETIISDKLKNLYPEFQESASKCRFTGCTHISEPDCGVKETLNDDKIDKGRYERYIEIYKTIKENERYHK